MAAPPDIERIARAAHEVNRTYCQQLGDNSHLPWDEAPKWQKDSARNGVLAVLEDRTKTPEQQHESWMRQKIDEGWVYGKVKDADVQTHPCLVPFHQLPPEQQAKNSLFRATVLGMLPESTNRKLAGMVRELEAEGAIVKTDVRSHAEILSLVPRTDQDS